MSPRVVATPATRPLQHAHRSRRRALEDAHAAHPGALGERHRDVDRVHASVIGDVEAGEQTRGVGDREALTDLGRADLVHVEPAHPVERGDPPVLLEASFVGGRLDEADGLEAGRESRLRLELAVELTGVETHRHRRLGERAEARHQARGVPRRAGRQAVPLQQHDIGPAGLGQVIGDRAPDHAAADDHHSGTGRKTRQRSRSLRDPPGDGRGKRKSSCALCHVPVRGLAHRRTGRPQPLAC